MPASAVLTVRIDPKLLAALKRKAQRDGQTVSAAVVRLVKQEVGGEATRASPPRSTMGMFPEFDAPDRDDLVRARQRFSKAMLSSALWSDDDG